MLNTVNVDFHTKRLTDFHLKRIIRAEAQSYAADITAYLSDVMIFSPCAVGIVFGHKREKFGRFADGHVIRTSVIRSVQKEGRFWVLTTLNSRYVIASFKRGDGRNSLRYLLNKYGAD